MPQPLLSCIIPITEEGLHAYDVTLQSLPSECPHIFIHASEVPGTTVPGSIPWVAAAIEVGLARAQGEWVMVLHPAERLPPADHVARLSAPKFMPPSPISVPQLELDCIDYNRTVLVMDEEPDLLRVLQRLPNTVQSALMLHFWVEDNAGHLARAVTREVRLLRRGVPYRWTPFGFKAEGELAVLVHHPVLHQPLSAYLYTHNLFTAAKREAALRGTPIDRRIFIKARAELEKREAIDALRVLYTHMSFAEELGRLRELMKHLPYTIDTTPEVLELKSLLKAQIGHLDEGEERWYRDGSPSEVVDDEYIQLAGRRFNMRVAWLVQEARARKHARVVELGSVDGVNLFDYIKLAPEVEWHGVEINPAAVHHGKSLAAKHGIDLNLHNFTFDGFAATVEAYKQGEATPTGHATPPFDAVAVFEVLEHNFEPHRILDAAERCLRPGGRVYICTPNGAWSQHNESTRKILLRKDHIRAYTPERMRTVLEERGAQDLQIHDVENPDYHEANSWVFASYVPREPKP